MRTQIVRVGLLLMEREDMENIGVSTVEDSRQLDRTQKIETAANVLLRMGMMQNVTPFGYVSPFHQFVAKYLYSANLKPALVAFRRYIHTYSNCSFSSK